MLTADPVAISDASGVRSDRAVLLVGVVLLVALGIALRGYFFQPQISRSPDEYTYTWQANLILQRGFAAFGLLGDQVLASPAALAIRPSPIRAGYLWLLASVMTVTGEHGPLAGAYIALVASCLNLCLVAFAAWRWLSPRSALIAALFGSTFPCDLVMARRAWQDAWIELLCDIVLIAALALLTARFPRSPTLLASFGVLGVACALTKENAALFFALCAAILVAYSIRNRNYRFAVMIIVLSGAAFTVAFGVLAVLFHGPADLIHLEKVCLHFSKLGTYEVQFDSGTPMMFVVAMTRVAPVLECAGVLACLRIAYRRVVLGDVLNSVAGTLALLFFCTLAFQIGSGRYNLRYAAPCFGSLILLGSATLSRAASVALRWIRPLGRPIAIAAVIFALAVAALRDFNFGRDRFLNTQMQDLALRPVLGTGPALLTGPSDLPVEGVR